MHKIGSRGCRCSPYLVSLVVLISAGVSIAQNRDGNPSFCDPQRTKLSNPFEILDTQKADLIPYVRNFVFPRVRENWYSVIPPDAMPPLLKQGCLAIEFKILKNGTIAEVRYLSSSGNVFLDRAAYGGVTSSSPFPPLPDGFKGESLKMRFNFFYNLQGVPPAETQNPSGQPPPMIVPDLVQTASGLSRARVLHIVEPEYPKQAHKKKIHGSVILKATIDQRGKVTAVSVVSGDPMLSPSAVEAVKTWTFEPFVNSGQPVDVQQELTINFALHWNVGELDSSLPPATILAK